jgi:hypothetical protein
LLLSPLLRMVCVAHAQSSDQVCVVLCAVEWPDVADATAVATVAVAVCSPLSRLWLCWVCVVCCY